MHPTSANMFESSFLSELVLSSDLKPKVGHMFAFSFPVDSYSACHERCLHPAFPPHLALIHTKSPKTELLTWSRASTTPALELLAAHNWDNHQSPHLAAKTGWGCSPDFCPPIFVNLLQLQPQCSLASNFQPPTSLNPSYMTRIRPFGTYKQRTKPKIIPASLQLWKAKGPDSTSSHEVLQLQRNNSWFFKLIALDIP